MWVLNHLRVGRKAHFYLRPQQEKTLTLVIPSVNRHGRRNDENLSNDSFVRRNPPTERTPALDAKVLRMVTCRRKGTNPSNVKHHWYESIVVLICELISAKIFHCTVLNWHSAVVQHSHAPSLLQNGIMLTLSGIYFFFFFFFSQYFFAEERLS